MSKVSRPEVQKFEQMSAKEQSVHIATKTVEQKAMHSITKALQKATRPSESNKPV